MEHRELPRYVEFGHLTVIEYLALLWPDRSRRGLAHLFARGRIRSGGRPVAMGCPLGELADLTLHGSLEAIPAIPCPEGATVPAPDILAEDDRLIVLAKPSGLPVVPDRTRSEDSVLGRLIRRELAARAAKPPADFVRYRVVHRLDRLTSGLLMVAKTPAAERDLAAAFATHRIEKNYLAILEGVVAPAKTTVDCPVVPGRKGRMRAEPRAGAAPARTHFVVRERIGSRGTLVVAAPITGRTHQIRVHAWATGHPVAGDPLYWPPPGHSRAPAPRLALHAWRYTLPADWPGQRAFECPLAEDLDRILSQRRR
jgi:RluA family pseudouridine synthase